MVLVLTLSVMKVQAIPSGLAAVELVRGGQRFDLVLCDLGMPDLNGWQVAERIAALSPATRIYLLTGWAQEIDDEDPRRELLAGVLPKPLDLDRLRRALAG